MKISVSILIRDLLGKRRSFIEKLACINLFENNSPQTVLSAFKRSGIDGVELLLTKETSLGDLQEAKKIFDRSDLSVLSIHQPLRFFSRTTLSEVEKLFDVAKILKAKVITLHLNAAGKQVFDKKYIDEIRSMEKKYNILVGYENSQKHVLSYMKKYVWSDKEFFDFVAKIGFHVTFDTTHFGQTGGNIVDAFKVNRSKIINIHIGDYKNHAFSSSFRPFAYTHLSLGEGDLPIKKFLSVLKEKKYEGLITMEIDRVNYQGLCKNAMFIKSSLK